VLRLTNVTKRFGERAMLRGVHLQVAAGARVGLVGANGAGKTTLMRAILGHETLDGGAVHVESNATVAFLPQDAGVRSENTLWEEMLAAFPALAAVSADLHDVTEALSRGDADGDVLEALIDRQAALLDDFERLGGYTVEADAHAVLSGLGFTQDDEAKRTRDFSGGWQMRIALAKLLVQKPDLILLDEPTNHLDARATAWLQGYLTSYPGTIMLTSHDGALLDAVVTRVFEIDDGAIEAYDGSYTDYERIKARRTEDRAAEYARQQKFIQKQQAFINSFQASANHASLVQSRVKLLARLVRVPPPAADPRALPLAFVEAQPMQAESLRAEGVAKRYGDRTIVEGVDLRLTPGQRVALVGPNGAGKSTLLRVLAGVEAPSAGTVACATTGYFAQDQSQTLDASRTVLSEIRAHAPADWSEERCRGLLGRFRFAQGSVHRSIGYLSGGEKSRLSLAKLLLQPVQLLVMDEPTNHLDALTREALLTALEDFKGTILFASHDDELLERLATHVVDVHDGVAELHTADYAGFKERLAASRRTGARDPREDAVEALEADIVALQAERDALDERWSGGMPPDDAATHARLTERIAALETEMERLALSVYDGAVA
jgi:ATP-binding cassette subfamily F protein 3